MTNTVVACTNINLLKESQIPAVPSQNELYAVEMDMKKYTPNILDFKWSDHLLNDQSWTRADTFSWQDGTVYTSAYNHLSADISGKTLQSETIGVITVQFYLADDGHKICPASEESNVASIYTNTGVAWYYILDTTNTRFKLPRSTYNRYSKELPVKGNGMTLGLTNGVNDGGLASGSSDDYFAVTTSAYGVTPQSSGQLSGDRLKNSSFGVTTDTTKSGIIASSVADSDMYLYFYVGEFSQTATEQTAGLNAELFNSKADINTPSIQAVYLKESYVNDLSGYNIWSNGYCEQWGNHLVVNGSSTASITLLKKYASSSYNVIATSCTTASYSNTYYASIMDRAATGFTIRSSSTAGIAYNWKTSGYLAEGEY